MSIFPTKILLATDGSADAELALQAAVDLANGTNSELHIATVSRGGYTPTYRVYAYDPYYKTLIKELQREAQELLHEQVRKIEEAGGAVAGAHLKMGERKDQEIVQLSEEIGAGLVVMGSRGLGGMKRALMGSVSDSVVRHAHCPVLVVRAEEDGKSALSSKRILLATDGSEEAQLALRTAVDLVNSVGYELQVVHVGGEYYPGLETDLNPALLEEVLQELGQEAQEKLDEQVKKIEEAGGTVAKAHLKVGRPEQEVVILAEEMGAGLILLGSRGLGGMRRALMGSVSDSVVRHAHCPVLVVRSEKNDKYSLPGSNVQRNFGSH